MGFLIAPASQEAATFTITGATFDFGTHRRIAQGSDNWCPTWHADGHQYISWGDGGGIGGTNSDGRVSLGFARFEGADPQTAAGFNVWGGLNPENAATFQGKTYSIISIGGVLYGWVSPGSLEGHQEAELAKSTDNSATWTKLGIKVTGTNAPATNLIWPSALQMGQSYLLNEDGFLYFYWVGQKNSSGLVLQTPGELYLMRVPVGSIETAATHQWLTNASTPTWGAIADRVPCFEHAAGIGWCASGVCYIPPADLYLLVATTDTVNASHFRFYWGRNPWGPWTQFKDAPDFGIGTLDPQNLFGMYVSPKWMGTSIVGGEIDIVILTSGLGGGSNNDSYNSVKGKLTVAEV